MTSPGGYRRIVALLVAALLATAWAGCGGGEDDEGDAEAQAEYGEGLRPQDVEGLPEAFFAVAPQAPLTDEDVERIADAEIPAVREYMVWAAIDPEAPTGDYDWSSFDERVATAARGGLRVRPFLYGAPAWVARELDGHDCTDCFAYAPRSDEALAAWRDFAGAAVERYGPRGEFWEENPSLPELPIRDWQLWNEQNSPTFYRPKPDVEAFARLVAAGAEGIRAADPDAVVVLGGMFGTPLQGREPALTAWDFLAGMYAIDGAREHFDAVAVHPYAAKPEGVKEQVEGLRDEMEEAGDGEAELWVTELGWSSATEGNPLNRGTEGQAAQLDEIYTYLLRRRSDLNLGVTIWFSWRDNQDQICDWCPESGLVTTELEPKPALEALTAFTHAAAGGP